MADIVTGTITGQVDTMDLTKEIIKNQYEAVSATKDSRYDVIATAASTAADLAKQVDAIDDTLTSLIHGVSRDTMDLRAQVTGLGYQVRDGFVASAKDSEINSLKTQIETAKQTTYLSDKIDGDGEKTRHLINEMKYGDLNRALIERNSELVEEREGRRHWRYAADQNQVQGQWASLQSQLQAFASQLQEVRQGTVNFGTMSGNAGRNTSTNNVV